MKALGVIPARYGSTRLEGKPLADICGRPMIEHVYKRAAQATSLDLLLVATDDNRIASAVAVFGGRTMMTSAAHNSGTDRVAEVARRLPDYDVVVNVQGDEPLLDPRIIDQVVAPLADDSSIVVSTAARVIRDDADYSDPNVVKVATKLNGDALYFSRSLIPYPRTSDGFRAYEHVGIYCYRRDFLLYLSTLPRTPLERLESLEQLRVLENGHSIRVLVTDFADNSPSVDTVEDLAKVRAIMLESGNGV